MADLIHDIKHYLLYLKEIGITELPVAQQKARTQESEDKSVVSEQKGEAASLNLQSEVLTLKSVQEELGNCQRCKLATTRTNIVFGVGNPHASIVFVGEGPGEDEDLQGEPFVGRAGQLLTKIIKAMGFERKDVYICNVVKCRPPGNRNPELDEIAACRPFLEKQLDAIKPKIIVALGTHAVQTLLNTEEKITALRGRFRWYRDGIQIMPTFHPSYLLRNEGKKKEVWEDMKMVLKALGLKIPDTVK